MQEGTGQRIVDCNTVVSSDPQIAIMVDNHGTNQWTRQARFVIRVIRQELICALFKIYDPESVGITYI